MKILICIIFVVAAVVHVADCVIFSWLWNVDPLEQSSLSNHTSRSNRNPVKKQVKYQNKLFNLFILNRVHLYELLNER